MKIRHFVSPRHSVTMNNVVRGHARHIHALAHILYIYIYTSMCTHKRRTFHARPSVTRSHADNEEWVM